MVRLLSRAFIALVVVVAAPAAFAQGIQTGSIRGVVKDATGQVVPQVSIVAVSPAQIGTRQTASDAAGADGHVSKPVTALALMTAIEAAMDWREQQDEAPRLSAAG